MRRPGRIALASTVVLVALGLPFTGVKFISVSAAVLPHSASARQVDDALRTQFPPNRTSPLQVVVGAPAGSPQVSALVRRLAVLPDVAAVAPAQPAGTHMALIALAPASPPLSEHDRNTSSALSVGCGRRSISGWPVRQRHSSISSTASEPTFRRCSPWWSRRR